MFWIKKSFFARSYFNDGAAGAGDAGGTPPATPPAGKTFTQADVDRFIGEERRKLDGKAKGLLSQLETLQQSSQLTQKERDDLAAQIEEIKTTSMTKEQVLTRDLESYKTKLETTSKTLAEERDGWQSRYNSVLVKQAITEAAATHDAFRPEQLLTLLSGNAKLVEEKDDDGKATGHFKVLFKFNDVDSKTKKPVTLELPAGDVMKRMKELPEQFGNLFKSTMQPGTGGGTTKKTKTGEVDYAGMTPEEYRAFRKTRGY
jgi:FtsZ-binding cell division protein ZapB